MKRLLAVALALMLALGAAIGAGADVRAHGAAGADFEGEGFETPEEAVLAYVAAMDRADLMGMISTFAIETWARQADAWALVERTHGMDPTYGAKALPVGGDYLRDLRVTWRCGDLMNSVARQYVWHAFMRDVYEQSATGSIVFQDGRSLDEFYAQWTSAPLADWEGHVQFVEWIDPDVLTEGKSYFAQNLRNAALMNVAPADSDDFADLVAHLRLNGQDALLFMTCASYGGRWYNLNPGSMTSNIIGLDANSRGLLIVEDDVDWRSLSALQYAEPNEGKALLEGTLRSPLLGTRWALTAIDGDAANPVILPDRAALEAYAGGEAAWGQLVFSRGAYVLQVRRSPARTQKLFADRGWSCAAGVWQADGAVARLYRRDGSEIPARFDGGGIALTDEETGLTYTFEAANPAPAAPQGQAAGIDRLEGDGYGSPADAVLAYIEAFNAGDTKAMLSTFAIETWAERADSKYQIEQIQALQLFNAAKALPADNGYALQARIAGRYGALTRRLINQYMDCGGPEEYEYGYAHSVSSGEEEGAFWQSWLDAPGSRWAGNVQFLGWLNADKLIEGRLSTLQGGLYLTRTAEVCGCDDVTPVVACLRLDGRYAALMLDCGQYDGRWYNLEPGGVVAMYAGMESSKAGLVIVDDETAVAMLSLVEPLPQTAAADNLNSGLAGSRWALTKVSGDSLSGRAPAIAADPQAMPEGDALWGELRFGSVGCAIHLVQSDAFRDALPLVDKGFTRMLFVWRPESGGVTLKNQDNADLFARVDANALTFTDPNTNVTYTFERK